MAGLAVQAIICIDRHHLLEEFLVALVYSAQQWTFLINAAQISRQIFAGAIAPIQLCIQLRYIQVPTAGSTTITLKHSDCSFVNQMPALIPHKSVKITFPGNRNAKLHHVLFQKEIEALFIFDAVNITFKRLVLGGFFLECSQINSFELLHI